MEHFIKELEALGLTPEQLTQVQVIMRGYALAAMHDSSVAKDAWSVTGWSPLLSLKEMAQQLEA